MDDVQKALRDKFSEIHPLVFHRCMEKARTNGELFDLLDGMPSPPFMWDEKTRAWVHVNDVLQKDAIHIAVEKGIEYEKQKNKKEEKDD